MTILLTGTHLTPALATIQALKKKAPAAKLVYVGRKHTGTAESVEKEEIERAGAEFRPMTFGKFHRHFTWRQILELAKFPVGFWQAGKFILELRPDAVVSFGGYVSLPVAIWGKLVGAKLIIHEQTTEWGLANRLLRPVADVTAVSWKEMVEPGTVWTGNPIRQEVLKARGVRRGDDPRQHFFDTLGLGESTRSGSCRALPRSDVLPLDLYPRSGCGRSSGVPSRATPRAGYPVLYITGGNQGAKAIDEVVAKILPDLMEKFEVFHQTKSKINFRHPRYHTAKWFSTPIHAEILSKTAVSVSRAGANTAAELMYLGIPSILIPLPDSAGGEQEKNAEMMVETGLGKIIDQKDLSAEKLLEEIMNKSYKSYKDYKEGEKDKREQKDRKEEGNSAADKLAEVILGVRGVRSRE